MFTIFGRSGQFCDGQSRRNFLKLGSLAMGGVTLPDILRSQATAARTDASGKKSAHGHKAVIMIYQPGGPTQYETVDPKPDAPAEIRGSFQPIATKTPGIEICEMLPRLAANSDKLAIIRSLVGSVGRHDSFQCYTGRSPINQPAGGWPTFGAAAVKLKGEVDPAVPPYIDLGPKMSYAPYRNNWPSFLGVGRQPFSPQGEGRKNMTLNGVSTERFGNRKSLLSAFDQFRRDADSSGAIDGMDAFTKQAFGLLTSSKMVEALNLEREDKKTRERYGEGGPTDPAFGGAVKGMQNFLLARRMVEAGARCVSVAFGAWDWHSNRRGPITQLAREDLPMFDQGLSALLEDLSERGMLDDVLVVVWGEFGRTPKINAKGGRDHWPRVAPAIIAGGGMKMGQVIGSTDHTGGEAKTRPVHYQEVFATIYHHMGIDVNRTTVTDLAGRPRFLVEQNKYQPIGELI